MTEGRTGVLVLVAGYPPAFLGGGPIRTIEAMVETRKSEAHVSVLTAAHDHGRREFLPVPVGKAVPSGRASVQYNDMLGWKGRCAYLRALRSDRSQILYLNSLFGFWFSIIPIFGNKLRLWRFQEVVLAPRGELDAGALAIKPWRKRGFLTLARTTGLYRKITWHASSAQEMDRIQRVFNDARVIVKENETLVRAREFSDTTSRTGTPKIGYVGRISPKKRIHVLIEAVASIPDASFELLIHGGGDPDYIVQCQELAAELSVDASFTGPIAHHDVASAFDELDFACFPTSGENFGHVVAEALARGCPVVIGDVTPWTARVRSGGGFIVEDDANPRAWHAAIQELLQETSEVRVRRRALALQAFKLWEETRAPDNFIDLLISPERHESL